DRAALPQRAFGTTGQRRRRIRLRIGRLICSKRPSVLCGEAPMNDVATAARTASSVPADALAAVNGWLGRFEAALRAHDAAALHALFATECHHRDLLAFSWTIRPAEGAEAIAEFLAKVQPTILARDFAVAADRTPPRLVRRLGIEVIEGIFRFDT